MAAAGIVRGTVGIRATMAAYIDVKPHMDVVTHYVTQSGDVATTRSKFIVATGATRVPAEPSA